MDTETNLLLHCIRAQLRSEKSSTMLSNFSSEINWSLLLEKAAQHSVTPLLYKSLNEFCPERVPSEVLTTLRTEFQNNTFRALWLTSELRNLLELLSAKQIKAVPFKGITLAAIAYPEIGLRATGDLDILVMPEDYLSLRSQLEPYGYCVVQDWLPLLDTQANQFCWYLGEYPMTKGGVCIDIHYRLVSGELFTLPSVSFDQFWERLTPISLGKTTILSFCAEDLLLYLCINGLRDCWHSLKTVCDIAQLIQNCSLDWQQVQIEAKRMGIRRALYLGLQIAAQTLEVTLPKNIQQEIEADSRVKLLSEQACQQLLGVTKSVQTGITSSKVIFQLSAIDRLRDQLSYILALILRTFRLFLMLNVRDQAFLPLPPRLYFLHYLVRPIRLLKEHGFRVTKLIFP